MPSTKTISIQAISLISDFISRLSQEGDLKDLVFWFEKVWGKHAKDTLFHPIEVTCSISRTYASYKITKTFYD